MWGSLGRIGGSNHSLFSGHCVVLTDAYNMGKGHYWYHSIDKSGILIHAESKGGPIYLSFEKAGSSKPPSFQISPMTPISVCKMIGAYTKVKPWK
jgi:hypothetical protein